MLTRGLHETYTAVCQLGAVYLVMSPLGHKQPLASQADRNVL